MRSAIVRTRARCRWGWRSRSLPVALALPCLLLCAGSSYALPAGSASIAGTVTSTSGQPLPGVEVCQVALYDEGGKRSFGYPPIGGCAQTDSEGDYRLEGLGAAVYTVRFSTSGQESSNYVTQFYDEAVSLEDTGGFVLAEGEARTGIDATLETAGSLAGAAISGSTGAAIGFFNVCALRSGEAKAIEDGCDGFAKAGSWKITKLPPGQYNLRFIDQEGGYDAPEYYPGAASSEAAVAVTVTVGETTQVGQMTFAEDGEITGTVTNASIDKQPIEGVEVCAVAAGREEGLPCATTDAAGQYTINVLEAGEYRVEVKGEVCREFHGCAAVYQRRFYGGVPSLAQAQTLTVANPGVASGIDVSLIELNPTTPASAQAPSISGPAIVGHTLTCSPGVWNGNPTALSYAWLRNGGLIAGAHASSYTLARADAGAAIRCRVSASNGAGSAASLSAALEIPEQGLARLVGTPVVRVGVVLLQLRCVGAGACEGLARLSHRISVKPRNGTRVAERLTRSVRIGLARFAIPAGARARVEVHPTGIGRELLRRAGGRGLRVTLHGTGVKPRTVVLAGAALGVAVRLTAADTPPPPFHSPCCRRGTRAAPRTYTRRARIFPGA
jgi:hypothetical protein